MTDAEGFGWLEVQLKKELSEVRTTGLNSAVRNLDLPATRTIAQRLFGSSEPEALVELLNQSANRSLGGEDLTAVEALFGLSKKLRNRPHYQRREIAAEAMNLSKERFRKDPQERLITELADGIRRFLLESSDKDKH